jgi:hypothetical protein
MLSAFMLFLSAIVVALVAGPDPAVAAIPSTLQSILKNTHGSKEYGYPTLSRWRGASQCPSMYGV